MNPQTDKRAIAIWLLTVAALIFAMVVVGGVTRLTRSGLSIVEWQPIVGTIPPLTAEQWNEAFDKYKLTPEYREVNYDMSLEGFKRIFYVEWAHRLLGRLIGIVFLVPLLYFWLRRRIDRALVPKLAGLFVLGGLQGALGWYMVKSGLVDVPRVSPYRLTAHLGLAVAIYGAMLWIAFGLLQPAVARAHATGLCRFGIGVTTLISLEILAGGFVAGTHAGFGYNTFPLMNGHFFPEGMWTLAPWWRNLFENIATVQFDHRLIAYTLIVAVSTYWLMALREPAVRAIRWGFHLLLAAVALQVLLGISTLLLIVPIPLAAAHQAGALVVFTVSLYLNFRLASERRRR